jgi:hypothetical protein
MIHFDGKFENSKFAWELCMFHKLREWSDGLSLFECKVNYDKYVGDHTPRFEIFLVLFNYTILDFSIYNIYHEDHENYRQN